MKQTKKKKAETSKQEIHHSFWTADGMLFPFWTPFLNNMLKNMFT